jgi:hypothetical protein
MTGKALGRQDAGLADCSRRHSETRRARAELGVLRETGKLRLCASPLPVIEEPVPHHAEQLLPLPLVGIPAFGGKQRIEECLGILGHLFEKAVYLVPGHAVAVRDAEFDESRLCT